MVVQPTFTRYVFELPELIGVSADNTKDKLTLTFDALLRFDLADAKATLPPVIEAIDSELDQEAVLVRFTFSGKVDVRTFREDNSYVVDVSTADAKEHAPGRFGALRRAFRARRRIKLAQGRAAGGGSRRRPCRRDPDQSTAVEAKRPPACAGQAAGGDDARRAESLHVRVDPVPPAGKGAGCQRLRRLSRRLRRRLALRRTL